MTAENTNSTTLSSPPIITKANAENTLFALWKDSSPENKEEALTNLLPHLKRHAYRMVWMVLKQTNDELALEMVHDLMMDLDSFSGNSLFSSWVHARFRNACIDELRYRRRYLGESLNVQTTTTLENNPDMRVNSVAEARVYMNEVLNSLPPEDREIVTRHLLGDTHREISRTHSLTRSYISQKLRRIYGEEAAKHE